MFSNVLDTRIGELESRVERIFRFLNIMHWTSHAYEVRSLRQKFVDLKTSFRESIDEARRKSKDEIHDSWGKIDEEIKSNVDKLESSLTNEVHIIVD